MFQKKVIHYPTLKTIIMVESILQEQNKPVTKNFILEKIPKKIMKQTLNVILEYLELSGKVLINQKGVEWTFDENKQLKIALKKVADTFT